MISFVYGGGRSDRAPGVRDGTVASDFYYGAAELERTGLEVRLHDVDLDAATGLAWRPADWLQRAGVLPPRVSGAALAGTRRLLGALQGSQVVVATSTALAFGLAWWRCCGRLRAPLVGIHCGLLNQPLTGWRRRTAGVLLRQTRTVLLGESEQAPLLARIPGIAARVRVIQFGVDTAFWRPDPGGARAADGPVLAIGNDGRRDFETLLAAAPAIAREVVLITRRPLPARLPANVRVVRGDWHGALLSDAVVRQHYRAAACVVVPLLDSLQPAGQSVTLQAMACGAPVVLTRTRGLWAPAALRDGDRVRLVPPGDAPALAAGVSELLARPADACALAARGEAWVRREATMEAFAAILLALCRELAPACAVRRGAPAPAMGGRP